MFKALSGIVPDPSPVKLSYAVCLPDSGSPKNNAAADPSELVM